MWFIKMEKSVFEWRNFQTSEIQGGDQNFQGKKVLQLFSKRQQCSRSKQRKSKIPVEDVNIISERICFSLLELKHLNIYSGIFILEWLSLMNFTSQIDL